MAQTTTDVNACDVAIWLDDDAGVPKDISGSSNQASISIKQNIGDLPTFGVDWPRRKACGRDATVKLVVVYSTAADEGMDILKQWMFGAAHTDARTLTIYIPDKNVGSDAYEGEFVLETLEIPVQAGDGKPIAVNASLSVSGALDWSASAT